MAETVQDVFRRRLRQARELRGWSQAKLAAEAGGGLHQTTVAKIEAKNGRGVSITELVALAAALDTSPVALLLPGEEDSTVDLGPVEADAQEALEWMLGRRRLRPAPVLDLTVGPQGPSPRDIARMPPEQQQEALRELVAMLRPLSELAERIQEQQEGT